MRELFLLCFIFLGCASLSAQDVQRLVREAEAAFQAGQYAQASESYSELLKQELTAQQRALCYYNYGTSLLQLGKWETARQAFSKVENDDEAPPLIRLRLYVNTAVATLAEIHHRREALDEESAAFASEAKSLLQLALQGLESVTLAFDAERILAIQEGRPSKNDPLQIQLTERKLKQEYAFVQDRLDAYEVAQLSLGELSQYLLEKLQETVSYLDIVGSGQPGMILSLRERAIELRQLERYWDALRRALKDREDEKVNTFFFEAEKAFYTGREWLLEEALWPARGAFSRCLLFLHVFSEHSAEKDPLLWVLERRILLRERMRAAAELPDYLVALQDEEQLYSKAAVALLSTMEFSVEEDEPLHATLAKQLAGRLAERLQRQVNEREHGGEEAWNDLAHYKQIFLRIGESLQSLRMVWDHSKQRKSWEAQDRAGATQTLRDWQALQEKLDLRETLAEGEERERTRATAVELSTAESTHESAIEGEREALDQLWKSSTRALYAWDLRGLIETELSALIQAHQSALSSDPLTPSGIRLLQDRGEELGGWIRESQARGTKDSYTEAIEKELVRASRGATDAIAALRAGDTLLARVFLTAARNDLARGKRIWNQPEQTPIKVLETGILEQGQVLDYNRAAQAASLSGDLRQRWLHLLVDEQAVVLQSVEGFADAVLNTLQGGEGEQASDPSLLWQAEPWKEVMPLFEAGVLVAVEAKELLEQPQPSLAEAAQKKSQAITYWKEALELLKQDGDGQNQSGQGGGQDDSESESSDTPPSDGEDDNGDRDQNHGKEEARDSEEEPQAQRASAQAILEELRNMVQDDQEGEGKKVTPKQGLRPW